MVNYKHQLQGAFIQTPSLLLPVPTGATLKILEDRTIGSSAVDSMIDSDGLALYQVPTGKQLRIFSIELVVDGVLDVVYLWQGDTEDAETLAKGQLNTWTGPTEYHFTVNHTYASGKFCVIDPILTHIDHIIYVGYEENNP